MEFSLFEENCLELVKNSRCRGRHSLRCAINHLQRAWALRKIDPEMAVFRAITAEEEAASGLFHALKHRQYQKAQLLNPRNHTHKSAVSPFIQCIGLFFEGMSESEKLKPKLLIQEVDGADRLRIAISVFIEGKELWAHPIPPLNFSVQLDGSTVSFKPEIEKFITERNAQDMLKYVQESANQRNKILYAGPDGYPSIATVRDEFFLNRKTRVFVMVLAYLLIEPYPEQQLFVQNALDAFLAMLKKTEDGLSHIEV